MARSKKTTIFAEVKEKVQKKRSFSAIFRNFAPQV